MNVSGIGASGYPTAGYEVKRTAGNPSGKGFVHTAPEENGDRSDILYRKKPAGTQERASVWDIYNSMSRLGGDRSDQAEGQESEAKSEMIVKPDGSRVLVTTMRIGGMETVMSLEISEPTEAPNETKQDIDHTVSAADAETNTFLRAESV